MASVMMNCTRTGKPISVGLDLELETPLNTFASQSVDCPACGRSHFLRKLYFAEKGPTEKHRYNVALESVPAFAAEVGVLISCFALVESYLPHLLHRLINITNEDAYVILGRFQMGERLQLLDTLARSRNPATPMSKAIEKLIPRLVETTATRNKYAHSQYSITFNDSVVIESWLNDSKRKNKPKSIEDINYIAGEVEKIQSLICDLHGLIYRNEYP